MHFKVHWYNTQCDHEQKTLSLHKKSKRKKCMYHFEEVLNTVDLPRSQLTEIPIIRFNMEIRHPPVQGSNIKTGMKCLKVRFFKQIACLYTTVCLWSLEDNSKKPQQNISYNTLWQITHTEKIEFMIRRQKCKWVDHTLRKNNDN